MPRRKQQAPRRSSAYVPEDELKAAKADDENLQDDGLSLDGQDGEFLCNEEDEAKEQFSYQNSPLSTATNPDAGYASPLSDSSDRLADFKSMSSKEGQDKVGSTDSESFLQDSLTQMKAVYANLISDASWSTITRDIMKAKQVGTRASSNCSSQTGSNGTTSKLINGNSSSMAASASTTNGNCSSGVSNGGGVAYDWHRAALAKTLQHTPYHLLPEPSLFSTVQLYRQNNKLYGPVFTGASKFRCKDCSAAYDTLVGLTVHMNETGHYRDDNKDKDEDREKKWSKPRKRSLMEMEGKEDAQKVLKCMYCGHSFESLQDLSVHMIKTKHYQKVPLKEPMPALATKLVPATKKRAFQDLIAPSSPESMGSTCGMPLGEATKDQKAGNPYVTANNRYGYQNGASYTWQFEARKAQILKCMECGSSHDTLQQLTAHMMVTGHFLKVTNSASKKGKQLVFDPVVEEKIQSIPLPPTTTRLPVSNIKSQPDSPLPFSGSEEKKEAEEMKIDGGEPEKKIKEEKEEPFEKIEANTSYKYLREEDLEETPKGGIDILKSLENTVSSAISKAQTGTPTWGGYPSIHAAYQLQGSVKSSLPIVQSVQVQPSFGSTMKSLSSDQSVAIQSPDSPSLPLLHKSNVSAMEELVEKVTGKVCAKKEEKALEKLKPVSSKSPSMTLNERKELFKQNEEASKSLKNGGPNEDVETVNRKVSKESAMKKGPDISKSPVSNGCNSLGVIMDHSIEQPFASPLSALQSIMNTHLGKALKPVSPLIDPLAMLYKISNSMVDKTVSNPTQANHTEHINKYFYESDDQPIDLTKSKNNISASNGSAAKAISGNIISNGKPRISHLSETVSSPLRENALMDISDMVKNLTGRLTPKSSTPSSVSERSDAEGSNLEDTLEELSPVQKRKGRQSNWNPQHLLILQAQFASSLRETSEGKFVMTDLGPQERVHICKFTGLSMTTISHWLANVKYQLRRTGGTKFLKNIDSGQPVFLCNDCASQFRTPSSYINHLESHLGFSLKDLSKLSIDLIRQQEEVSKVINDKTFGVLGLTEEDSGSIFQCKLCNRTFISKHAVKLHLSKTHSKSPEDHLIYVTQLEKLEKF